MRAVVMDESYERTQDALILLKIISQSEEDLKKGKWLTQAQMERELQKVSGFSRFDRDR